LKGSTVNRSTNSSVLNNGANASADERHTMKDNDLREKLYVVQDDAKWFEKQLNEDTMFLRHNGIMDYSLLLGMQKGADESI
jgi:hypothetical protein